MIVGTEGMQCVFMGDARRGLWCRRTKNTLVLKSGREGDDAEVEVTIGDTVTENMIASILNVMKVAEFASSGMLSGNGE